MTRIIWKDRSWLCRLASRLRQGGDSVSLDHGLYPEECFREKLAQERRRAARSKKAMVVMLVDVSKIRNPDTENRIAESLGEEVVSCLRGTDICGLINNGVLIGVILTEIKADKIETAQQVVAKKTRELIAALLSEELADQVTITFKVFTAAGPGNEIPDIALGPEVTGQVPAPGAE